MARPRRRKSTPFKAWGFLMLLAVALLVWQGSWGTASLVAGCLVVYLLIIRLTRCRVETKDHRPCRWLVRGLLGTCDFHRGYKRGLPRLINVPGHLLPMFMWPRADFSAYERAPTGQGAGADTTSERAQKASFTVAQVAIGLASMLIALIGLVRDFLTG